MSLYQSQFLYLPKIRVHSINFNQIFTRKFKKRKEKIAVQNFFGILQCFCPEVDLKKVTA